MNAKIIVVVALATAAVAACDQPKPRQPDDKAAAPVAAAPAGPQVATTTDPLPPLPPWAGAYMGKGLRDVFPGDGACLGNTDIVELRYQGAAPGAKIIGWGWDTAAKKVVERVVLVDKNFQIVGAGEKGLPRPDVISTLPQVTDENSGWSALTPLASGAVDSYGITGDGTAICKLGHLEF